MFKVYVQEVEQENNFVHFFLKVIAGRSPRPLLETLSTGEATEQNLLENQSGWAQNTSSTTYVLCDLGQVT